MITSIINPSHCYLKLRINYLDRRFHVLIAGLNTPNAKSTLEEDVI